jgi:hypothetical protein
MHLEGDTNTDLSTDHKWYVYITVVMLSAYWRGLINYQ